MKTAKFLTAAGAALCIAGLSAPANANPYPVVVDGVVSVSGNDSGSGLLIDSTPTPFTGNFNSLGDIFTVPVFTIGTSETWVNLGEDTVGYDITASFLFNSPLGTAGPDITGTTKGFISFSLFDDCGILAGGCGEVVWDSGPWEFVYGNVGKFSVALSDGIFTTPGTATVNGTFTLLAAVPEPSTWAMMILGFGAVGFMMRSRRRENVSVSYA